MEPPAVQSAERAAFADVFDRFLAGSTSVAQFAAQALEHLASPDRGSAAIADAWYNLGELDLFACRRTVHRLAPQERAALERCRLFLRTELPYEWPDPPNLTLAELGLALLVTLGVAVLGHLIFGLVIVFMGLWFDGIALIVMCIAAGTGVIFGYRALRQWKHDRWTDCTAAGDLAVWPFLRRADYERALRP